VSPLLLLLQLLLLLAPNIWASITRALSAPFSPWCGRHLMKSTSPSHHVHI